MTLTPGLLRPDRPAPRRLDALARHCRATVHGETRGRFVTGVTLRSQDARPGDLFVGLPGAGAHGAAYAGAAQQAGAVALLTDAAGADLAAGVDLPVLVVRDPRRMLGEAAAWILRTADAVPLLLGVTGTNGKTTTATLVEHLLRRLGLRTALSTTAERVVDGVRVASRLTTPEADELHALLAVMRERRVDAAAVEVSAQAIVRARVAGVRFDVAGFTNLTHDHLDDFGDMEAYFAAKAALFEPEAARRGVVSLDSPWGARLAARAGVPVTTIGADAGDWRVAVTQRRQGGTAFRLVAPDGRRLSTRVAMLGDHAASDAALAVAMLVEAGVDLGRIEAALGDDGFATAVPGRLERLSAPGGPDVLLDVAHTPDAFVKSLAALRAVTPGRIVMLFGADGDRDRSKRFGMGRVAGELADAVLITDHHSRFEDPEAIRASLLTGAASARRAEVLDVPDPSTAIRIAIGMTGPGDAVLWAGTGRTEYRDVLGTKIPYSFLAEARAALDELAVVAA
ncbi:Mur ligase family protein [Amnibacterium setariae]|uniref:UDP-N-acetylmuramyl-tripeptide synthetase n=1 Tax=Amnibacterium setariae TaxID=2306585 RepID=A0A3A1U1V0_9MICO|nr:UDP-N-acetylmuramoyl-L-alanyl-D-glutamate--2,6-diaminopimelate ligase [Amnibacterium setariae]RIX30834.1 UDP-N-acetylmuramoyl-L-alanyl-D-glutamate--2,6-diaminopimelate ligase [Amnibacterium setariae]